jgi:hypothetical protein
MMHIFRWNGEYFGFISNGHLFSAKSEYLAWVENDGSVWRSDESYLGELVEKNYILRNTSHMQPMSRMARMSPHVPDVTHVPDEQDG